MKIVLAYSGGLDTSIILKWLKEKYNAEIIAYAGEVGLENELDGLKEKAMKTGASKVYVEDLREEFITKGIYQVIKAGSVYEKKYLLGTSIARPFIAKRQVEIALKEGADAVAHGATGKGNDQVRFESVFKMMAPELKIIAPWRTDWELNSREKLIEYAKKNNIPVPVTASKPYSSDKNILHISYEGGILEDPMNQPNEDMFTLSVSPEEAPNKPEFVEIEFEKGIPIKVNGEKLTPIDLMKSLNKIGGRNAIGRVDIVENRLVGMKSRGVYETPAGSILMEAHEILESLILDAETTHYKNIIAEEYAKLVYNGRWYSPLKEALDSFIDTTQEKVTGFVKLKLYKGNIINAGRKSSFSLYNPDLATFEEDDMYNHKDAEGFINLYTLPLKMHGLVNKNVK